jgi:hypothetical protein
MNETNKFIIVFQFYTQWDILYKKKIKLSVVKSRFNDQQE